MSFDFDSIDLDDTNTWPYDEDLETSIESGWTDELYYVNDDNTLKVWQSRLTRADGVNWTHEVTLEARADGGWYNAVIYDPHDPGEHIRA